MSDKKLLQLINLYIMKSGDCGCDGKLKRLWIMTDENLLQLYYTENMFTIDIKEIWKDYWLLLMRKCYN